MPAQRLPSIQFFCGDHLKDPAVRSVSLAARGLWVDLICLMSEAPRRGYLEDAQGNALNEKQIARMTGCAPQTAKKLLQELEVSGVFSRTEITGIIYCRRMVRDEANRLKSREFGQMGGNPALSKRVNPPVIPDANPNLTPSSSSSSSNSNSQYEERARVVEFVRPTLEEVIRNCRAENIQIDEKKFFDHYESVGWTVLGKPMVCWVARAKLWEANDNAKNMERQSGTRSSGRFIGSNAEQDAAKIPVIKA